ncbi:hypothetical protein [Virgibacillus sp. Bac330]|uniref:hypothetical protein n=1 Tax=Virgibacillus sp. Bac330 TaxID=2419841 RepID=UPI000EF45FDA|nr:hypothetical protein [Virgibacillus sp. Bac330]
MKEKDLKNKLLLATNDELIEFIKEEFKSENLSLEHYKSNLGLLKKMDEDTINTSISRMVEMESRYDNTKTYSLAIPLILAIIAGYSLTLEGLEIWGSILSLVLNVVVLIKVVINIGEGNGKKATASYFKELLGSIKN